MVDKSTALAAVCEALTAGQQDEAVSILRRDYPMAPEPVVRRQYGLVESTRVFCAVDFLTAMDARAAWLDASAPRRRP